MALQHRTQHFVQDLAPGVESPKLNLPLKADDLERGADRSHILGWVLGQGAKLAGIGLVLGLGGAVATTRFTRGMLFGVEPLDPLTFGGTAVVLLFVALAAALIPAWRATRVDPVECLRSE